LFPSNLLINSIDAYLGLLLPNYKATTFGPPFLSADKFTILQLMLHFDVYNWLRFYYHHCLFARAQLNMNRNLALEYQAIKCSGAGPACGTHKHILSKAVRPKKKT